MADDVLYQGVKGVSDLMVRPGLINLDFADVRAVMDEMGKAMMGTGEASGPDRAVQAAEKAIANPLLDEISLNGAKGVLINITGGYDLTLFELDEAANIIREKVDPDANIIVGSTLDTSMEGVLRVSVVATGIDIKVSKADMPHARRSMHEPLKPMAAPQPEARREPPMALTQPVAAAEAPMMAEPVPARQQFEPAQTFEPEVDELPAPAYRPAPAGEQRASAAPAPRDNDAASFIAPRPRPMGSPSAEAMARLQAAVSKSPVPQPQARGMAPAAKPAAKPAERPRFGIGSLINRMSGSHAEAAQPSRAQPPVTAYDEEAEPATDQDRMEIPAFLRRQAN